MKLYLLLSQSETKKNQTNIFSANTNRNETGQLQTSKEKLSHLNILSEDYTKSRFLHRGEELNILFIFLTEVLRYFFEIKKKKCRVRHSQGIDTREGNCIPEAALCPQNVFRCRALSNVAEIKLTWHCLRNNLTLFGRKAIINIKNSWPVGLNKNLYCYLKQGQDHCGKVKRKSSD